MEGEINLLDIFNVIKSKLRSIVIISVITGLVVFLLCSFVIKPKYQSSIVLYVTNITAQQDSIDQNVNANDINASQKLVNTYKVILQTDKALDKLMDLTKLEYSKEDILEMISFSTVENTEVLKITATTNDPYLSANLCNGYADIAPEVIRDVIKGGSVQVLSRAKADGIPTSPNTPLFTLIAFFLGFVLSAVVYFLIDMFANTVKNEQDLTNKCNATVIGSIPDIFSLKELNIPTSVLNANKALASNKMTNKKLFTDFTIISNSSPFIMTEAYNMVRTNLMFSMSTTNHKVIIISSSLPNECKSTTAVNLAISMASTGSKVLLMEGDLRNPTLHRIFHKNNSKGLSRVLAGMSTIESAMVKDIRPNLDIVTGGPIPPNPSELLGSDKMTELVASLSENYDYIFIDSPPVNIVADALLLAKHAAGIIMLAREGSTKYSDLNKALTKIESTQANLLGIIITDSDQVSHSYGKYGYGYGYGYGQPVGETVD